MDYGMEILTIIAILIGPFLGIFVYGKIEDRKHAYNRKLDVYKTLMATRGAQLSPDYVNALNRIDVEFTADDEKAVREAWSAYLDHFSGAPTPPDIPGTDADEQAKTAYDTAYAVHKAEVKQWGENGSGRLVTLLKEMGSVLDYDFPEVHLKKGNYQPIAYQTREELQARVLLAAHDFFSGRNILGMHVTNWQAPTDEQRALIEELAAAIQDGAYNVRIIDGPQDQADNAGE